MVVVEMAVLDDFLGDDAVWLKARRLFASCGLRRRGLPRDPFEVADIILGRVKPEVDADEEGASGGDMDVSTLWDRLCDAPQAGPEEEGERDCCCCCFCCCRRWSVSSAARLWGGSDGPA